MHAQTAGIRLRECFLYSVKVRQGYLLPEALVHVIPAPPIPVALALYRDNGVKSGNSENVPFLSFLW